MANLTALGSGLVVSTQQKKIVAVVDDDLGMRVSLAVLFRAIGCVAETFDSAEAFLETFPTSKAGCLVLNIQLGDLSGVELARHLTAEGFKYPVIFTTAYDDEHLRRQAEEIGCVALLMKPFAAKMLIDAINLATGWSIEYPSYDAQA
jgi:FixJ family two-component response regulator